jgi:cell pole-organizing protein PopZ
MSTTQQPAEPSASGAPDPSMEEILASIRRILNEDEQPAGEDLPAESPPEDDVLVLDTSMLVSPPKPEPIEEKPIAEQPPPAPAAAAPVAPAARIPEREPAAASPPPLAALQLGSELVAPEAAAAAASSVGSLMRTLAAGRGTQVWSGGPTLEDIVRAELRPLLKDWLDVYLPPLVERLVSTEIERVVNRAVP